MKNLRDLRCSVAASLIVCASATSGCSGNCPGGNEAVSPESLDILGVTTYRSETAGEVQIELAEVTEPHYAEPIYDGELLDLEWEQQGMTFGLTLVGLIAEGTTPLADLGAQLCVCETGFLQGPADARECFRNGQVTPAACEALVGEAMAREIVRDCIGSGALEDCAERIDMDLLIPEADEARFSGAVMIRWFESIESRSCVEGPSIG
jgi:hypothetical protein